MYVKTWGIKLLKDKYKYYKKLLESAKTPEEKASLYKTVNSFKEFLDQYSNPPKTEDYVVVARKDQEFLKRIKKLLPILINANDYIVDNKINLKEQTNKIRIEKDRILTITKEFYENINGIFLEKYQEYYDNESMYINFLTPLGNSLGGNIARPKGVTEAYININTYGGLYDVASSVHEHGHAIGASINENHIDNPLIRELESIFFELLCLDEIDTQEYDYEDIYGAKEESVLMYHACLNTIDAKYLTTLKGKIDKNKNLSIIQEKYDLDKTYIDDILTNPLNSLVIYSMSYLIAVELLMLYKRNSYAALKILEDIIINNPTTEIELLNLLNSFGITPGKSLKQFYKQYLNIKGTSKKSH